MRIARAFAVTALAAATVAGTAPAALAGDASAQVSPSTVAPGGTVTVSVSCPSSGGSVPDTITANSQAFQQGSVQLKRNPSIPESGPHYSGTATVAPAGNFTNTGPNPVGPTSQWGVDGSCPDGSQWEASFTVSSTGTSTGGRGVRGGLGGSFTDDGTTMITGTVLVAGALGAAYWVLRRRARTDES